MIYLVLLERTSAPVQSLSCFNHLLAFFTITGHWIISTWTTKPPGYSALRWGTDHKNGARLHAKTDIARSYEIPQCGLQAAANARAKYNDWPVLSTYVIRALNTRQHFGCGVGRP